MRLEHKEYGAGIRVSGNFAPFIIKYFKMKRFGVVTRNGKKFLRNYNRELKPGTGLDVGEARDWHAAQVFNCAFSPLFDLEVEDESNSL